jgi:hypothetical protein
MKRKHISLQAENVGCCFYNPHKHTQTHTHCVVFASSAQSGLLARRERVTVWNNVHLTGGLEMAAENVILSLSAQNSHAVIEHSLTMMKEEEE